MKQTIPGVNSFEGLEDIARRLSNMVRVGFVSEVDYPNARVRVHYGVDAQGSPLVSGWLPWLTGRAGNDIEWHAPELGEQVLMISPSGELQLGVVLPALYQASHPAPASAATVHRMQYADGAVIEYDRAAHRLKATLPAGGSALLVCPGGVQIDGDTTINGAVTINGDTQISGSADVSGDVVANGISLTTHTHPGDSGGTTGQPQ
ncbi:phage baseplate assembly protein V [Thiomicrorhabdus cannonii]|uniref:phage baseplate assembly protein V n=1 Tax=Thiomicrorhabdus cannonii TaxID=2748011 RepID=UPI0015BBF426|nr:phage baseplate assembly protein V [Thiomicrorhabdus cannonii]